MNGVSRQGSQAHLETATGTRTHRLLAAALVSVRA